MLSLLACRGHYSSDTESQNLARVGDQYLTVEQARQAIPSFIYQEDSLYALKQYREQWIQEKLLLKEAQKLELEQQRSVQQQIEQARQEILNEAVRSAILSEVDTTVTDQEAQRYFDAHKQHFTLGKVYVQFRHFTTENIENARTAKRELQSGAPWEEVADSYAMEPYVAIRNAERYLPISSALEDVEIMQRYLQTGDINEISPIQRANGIYHFVQLTDRREKGDTPDLAWLIDRVKSRILLEKRQRKFNSYLKNLYLKAESDNEITSYNVLSTQTNPKNSTQDTLESNSTDG